MDIQGGGPGGGATSGGGVGDSPIILDRITGTGNATQTILVLTAPLTGVYQINYDIVIKTEDATGVLLLQIGNDKNRLGDNTEALLGLENVGTIATLLSAFFDGPHSNGVGAGGHINFTLTYTPGAGGAVWDYVITVSQVG
jgi:hypothetical protein